MLFSRDDVCTRINKNFEPVWISLRPVPIVRIDFGDGKVLTRTLHGNILTSVCTAGGRVIDALPGIYTPEVYLSRLEEFRLLAANLGKQPAAQQAAWLKAYHQKAVQTAENVKRFLASLGDVGKGRIERPTRQLLVGGVGIPPNGNPLPGAQGTQFRPVPMVKGPPPPTGWKELVQDTLLNEGVRRQAIHGLLAQAGLVTPDKVLKPIYRDVLHADLDDPYLGLGKTLFGNYPFAEDDKVTR